MNTLSKCAQRWALHTRLDASSPPPQSWLSKEPVSKPKFPEAEPRMSHQRDQHTPSFIESLTGKKNASTSQQDRGRVCSPCRWYRLINSGLRAERHSLQPPKSVMSVTVFTSQESKAGYQPLSDRATTSPQELTKSPHCSVSSRPDRCEKGAQIGPKRDSHEEDTLVPSSDNGRPSS